MLTGDPLAADVEYDIEVFKRHLNPIARGWEEAVGARRLERG